MRIDQRDIYKIWSFVETEMPNVFRLFVHSIVDLFFIRRKMKSRWTIMKRRFRGTADLTSGIALRLAVNQIIAFTAPIIFHANLHSPMQSKQKWFPIIPHNHCSRNCSGRVVKITRQNRVKSLTFIGHSWGREAWPGIFAVWLKRAISSVRWKDRVHLNNVYLRGIVAF